MSCDPAASALSPRPSTSEARRNRFSSDVNGDGRSVADATNAQVATAAGGFRALLKIVRETEPADFALLRARPAATDRQPARAPDEDASTASGRNVVDEDGSRFSTRSRTDADATASSSRDETSASAREGHVSDKDGRDEDEPGERDDDQATDASEVIALAVTLPVPSALVVSSASGAAQTASSGSIGLQTDEPISASRMADAARTAPGAATQTPAAPPPPQPSVQVQSIAEPVSSVPSHALLAGVVPLDAGGDASGMPALTQNGAPGTPGQNSAQNSAEHIASTVAGTSGQAAPPQAANTSGAPGAAGANSTAGTGLTALAAATSQNLAGTGGSDGGGAQDGGEPGERDARSPETGADADILGVHGTEDSFAAGLTPSARGTTSPRAAAGSTATAAANPASTCAQVAQQLGKAAKSGLQRVEIALEPAALGHIDVRLEFGRDGRVAAHFTADSREALNALQADTRGLERALQDAGVRADAGSLGFSLRGESGGDHRSSFASRTATIPDDPSENPRELTQARVNAFTGGTVADGRLDIRA